MFDPVFLIPAALLTGVAGIGHIFYARRCVALSDELKQFEYRATGKFCFVLCSLAVALLVFGQFAG